MGSSREESKEKDQIDSSKFHRDKLTKQVDKSRLYQTEFVAKLAKYKPNISDSKLGSHYDYAFGNYAGTINTRKDCSWKILACNIFTKNALPIFNWDFGSKLEEYDSHILLKLANALEQFASDSLQTDFLGFYINNEFLVIKELESHFLLMNVALGSNVLMGKNTELKRDIDTISQEIGQILALNYSNIVSDTEDLKEEAIYQIIKSAKKAYAKPQPQLVPKFDINMIFVMGPDGKPLLARTYDKRHFKEDPKLVRTFMYAVYAFYSTHIYDQLNKIRFTRHLSYTRRIGNYTYGIVLGLNSRYNISENNPIHSICEEMLLEFIQDVEDVEDAQDISPEILIKVSDNFVKEVHKDLESKFLRDT